MRHDLDSHVKFKIQHAYLSSMKSIFLAETVYRPYTIEITYPGDGNPRKRPII